ISALSVVRQCYSTIFRQGEFGPVRGVPPQSAAQVGGSSSGAAAWHRPRRSDASDSLSDDRAMTYLGRRTCAGSWVGMARIIMNRAFIARWTRTPHSIGRLSASASSHHSLSSAAFTTNIAESDFRHARAATEWLLVEAKANLEELFSNCGAKDGDSIKLIRATLNHVIPSPTDQNPWAHWRNPMDMMRQG